MKYYCYLKGNAITQGEIEDFITTQKALDSLMGNGIEMTTFLWRVIMLLAEILWIKLYIPTSGRPPSTDSTQRFKDILEGVYKELLGGVMRGFNGGATEIQSFLEDFIPAEYFKENTMDVTERLKKCSV